MADVLFKFGVGVHVYSLEITFCALRVKEALFAPFVEWADAFS